jgi:predicted DNA-binding WGR domain protein
MMLDQRFENRQKGRYYRLIVSQDLFGDWVVTRVWGGIGKANSRIIHVPCPSYDDAVNLFRKISKTRKQRGYQLCKIV